MNIHLHIDRLVVDGLPLTPVQARVLRASVESQLAAKFAAEPPRPGSSSAVPTLSAAPIAWSASSSATENGRHIAHSLHAALVPNVLLSPLSPAIKRSNGRAF